MNDIIISGNELNAWSTRGFRHKGKNHPNFIPSGKTEEVKHNGVVICKVTRIGK
jgi:hypothetical protein